MAKKLKKTRLQSLKPKFTTSIVILIGAYLAFFAYNLSKNGKFEIPTKEIKKSEEKVPIIDSPVQQKIAQVQHHKSSTANKERRPKYWFYMSRQYMWIFFSVDNVLRRLGLEKIKINVQEGEAVHDDWDLLWSYDYHNELPIDFKKVKYHQRINHIPGNYVLTMKDYFAINTKSKYIPKAFNDTEELKKYAKDHPEKRFVQKLWSNRGITLKKVEEMNFKVFGPGYKYFGQEYVEDPLLIDGRKFDFGVYVLISSIDPLRIFYYEKNILIRLCEEKYNKTDYSNVNSYVISDACMFPWDVDALSVYYNQSYTYKESLNAYLNKNGYDSSKIWPQVEECIRDVIVPKEGNFKYWMHRYAFKHTFFELYRFDFILNDNLDLFLIEINQSPNVNPSALLYRDQRMFENLLFNVFTLIGIGSYMPKTDFKFGNDQVEAMICHNESLTVLAETCVSHPCNESCNANEDCKLCLHCMDKNQVHELHLAYREVKNRGAMKRAFPPPKKSATDEYIKSLNDANRWQARWFMEMCKKDRDFC